MSQTINVDPELIEAASKLGGATDINVVISEALREYIRRRQKLQALLDVAGTIEFAEGYDHKQARKTRHDPS